jgi:hypothetical protein
MRAKTKTLCHTRRFLHTPHINYIYIYTHTLNIYIYIWYIYVCIFTYICIYICRLADSRQMKREDKWSVTDEAWRMKRDGWRDSWRMKGFNWHTPHWIYTYIYSDTQMTPAYTYIHIYIYIKININIYTYIYKHTYTYIHTYMYIYIRTYVYIYIDTEICRDSRKRGARRSFDTHSPTHTLTNTHSTLKVCKSSKSACNEHTDASAYTPAHNRQRFCVCTQTRWQLCKVCVHPYTHSVYTRVHHTYCVCTTVNVSVSTPVPPHTH